MKRILLIIWGIILCHAAQAQYKEIQILPQPLRDSILIDVANKAIDKYSIGYLQPGREPIIEDIGIVKKGIAENKNEFAGLEYPDYYGVYFYAVYYKTTEEEKFYYARLKLSETFWSKYLFVPIIADRSISGIGMKVISFVPDLTGMRKWQELFRKKIK